MCVCMEGYNKKCDRNINESEFQRCKNMKRKKTIFYAGITKEIAETGRWTLAGKNKFSRM